MPATPFPPSPRPLPRAPEVPALRRRAAHSALAALALTGLALAGCGSDENKFRPECPGLARVPDAQTLARFDGHGLDVTNLLVRASITDIPARCVAVDATTVRATLHVNADVRHGPAGGAGVAPIGYFIALTKGGTVLREQDFAFVPQFPPNVDRTSLHGDEIELLLPVSKKQTAAVYTIYVGFRLTPDQLAYNRSQPRP